MKTLYGIAFDGLGLFCHQLPERSLFLLGVQFPLCIRCTALTLGAVLAVVYLVARRPLPRPRVLLALCGPMAVEITLVVAGVFETTNTMRALTGLGFGFALLMGTLLLLAGWDAPPPPATSMRARHP